MDRVIVYIGEIPKDTDLLLTNKNAYVALSKLAAACFGTSTLLNGFACTPGTGLHVSVASGEIYSLQNIDDSAYGDSVDADTAHQILKQGISLDAATLSCPAPGTAGQSVNYLIEIAFHEADNDDLVLPFFDSDNPVVPFSGPANNGQPSNTNRQNYAIIQAKAGSAATTGSQTTPSPDSGFVGAFVVTVANGQSSISSGNITTYSGAPFLNGSLLSQINNLLPGEVYYSADTGAANAYVATISQISAYTTGQTILLNVANTNTSTTNTINLNAFGTKNIKLTNGSNINVGDMVSGSIVLLAYNGTNYELLNPATVVYQSQIQSGSLTYSADTGSANAYVATLSPAITSYVTGSYISVKLSNTNTSTTCNLNVNSLGNKRIKLTNGNDPNVGDLLSGMIARLQYDGTNYQLINPATWVSRSQIQNNSLLYIADTGAANAYVMTLSPAITAYSTGQIFSTKIANTNTSGTCTLNINSLGTKSIKLTNGSNPNIGDLASGMMAYFEYDGTNIQLLNPATWANQASIQQNTYTYATDTGIANAYVTTITPAPASYVAGLKIYLLIAHANSGASTINVNSLGVKNITNLDQTALVSGQIATGMIAILQYDGTQFQLLNSISSVTSRGYLGAQVFTSSGTYTPTSGTTSILAEGVGGGGGGGGAGTPSASTVSFGGGGGSGAHGKLSATAATIGASQTVTIGAAGSAGVSTGGAGGNGTSTSLGTLLVLPGGTGGSFQNSTAAQVANGGAGGIPTAGTVQTTGQAGMQGSGAYSSPFILSIGGQGGSNPLGQGGPMNIIPFGTGQLPGLAGTGYGSGGSGAAVTATSTGIAGGAGKPGYLIIYEYA
jgi:hypothetical protein